MEVLRIVSKHLARTAVVADGKSYRFAHIGMAAMLSSLSVMLISVPQLDCSRTKCTPTVQGLLAGTKTFWAGLSKQQRQYEHSSAATQMAPEVKICLLTEWEMLRWVPGRPHPGVGMSSYICAGSPVGPCFAIMAPPGPQYVAATWASWLTGGVAVPLCLTHPAGCESEPLQPCRPSSFNLVLSGTDQPSCLQSLVPL